MVEALEPSTNALRTELLDKGFCKLPNGRR
jgi:hypothetical protein